jgi:DNA-binding beta-propeller fold protein YncE
MIRRTKSTPEAREISPAGKRAWAAFAGVLIAGLGALALGGCGGTSATPSKPVALRIAQSVSFQAKIYDLAAGDGALWITSDGAVLRVDPKTGSTVARIPVAGDSLYPIAVGPSAVWVGVLANDKSHGLLVGIDPATNRVATTISLGVGEPMGIAVAPGTIWIDTDINGGTVYRVDPQDHRVAGGPLTVDQAGELVLGGGSLWVGQQMDTSVTRIDAAKNAVIGSPLSLGGENIGALVYADGALWAGDDAQSLFGSGSVVRVDPSSQAQSMTTISNQDTIDDLGSAFGRVWVLSSGNTLQLAGIDPATGKLSGPPIPVSGTTDFSGAIGVGEGGLWIITDEHTLTEFVPG